MRAGKELRQQPPGPTPRRLAPPSRVPGLPPVGSFLPEPRKTARPFACISNLLTQGFAKVLQADRVGQPTQPVCPFRLFLWPHNLTGQVGMSSCRLPIFSAARSRLAAARRGCFAPEFLRRPLACAEPRHLATGRGRSFAQGHGRPGSALDGPARSTEGRPIPYGRSKGSDPCVNPFLPLCLRPVLSLPPAVTPPVSRRFMVPAPVRSARPCSTAISSPVLPSGPLATCSIVSKTRAAASQPPADFAAAKPGAAQPVAAGRSLRASCGRLAVPFPDVLPCRRPAAATGSRLVRGGFASASARPQSSTTFSTTRDSTCLTRS